MSLRCSILFSFTVKLSPAQFSSFKTLKALITNRGCDTNAIIVIICVALFFSGFAYAGFLNPNILDLAPNHAGTLFGITNTFANIVEKQFCTVFIKKYLRSCFRSHYIDKDALEVCVITAYCANESSPQTNQHRAAPKNSVIPEWNNGV